MVLDQKTPINLIRKIFSDHLALYEIEKIAIIAKTPLFIVNFDDRDPVLCNAHIRKTILVEAYGRYFYLYYLILYGN